MINKFPLFILGRINSTYASGAEKMPEKNLRFNLSQT